MTDNMTQNLSTKSDQSKFGLVHPISTPNSIA